MNFDNLIEKSNTPLTEFSSKTNYFNMKNVKSFTEFLVNKKFNGLLNFNELKNELLTEEGLKNYSKIKYPSYKLKVLMKNELMTKGYINFVCSSKNNDLKKGKNPFIRIDFSNIQKE